MKEQEEKENQLKSRLGELEEELEKEKDENQKLQNKVKVNKPLHDTLIKVKTELENQKDQLNQKLQDVEIKRKENKEEVQMVEKKITEKENYDNKDLLLGEKEKLLQSQWKLDKKKKHYERQLLNIEKVMEPIEIHMMRTKKKMRIFRK
ncbi:filament-like plant protein 1 isoform X1 [Xiphophorus hellerii]|uniref:filament-like plant protein 1 isoform X1 n=1 Tax=Xiphophorus hellerii TaxID=8084 RepID=UPI0013B43B72|nr:filament-like plant protein 1 isoform X1 [Xiphophorus hellerii]